jgi:hypothetical protein
MHSKHSGVDGTTEEQYVPQTWHSTLEILKVKVTDHPIFVEYFYHPYLQLCDAL